MSTPRCPARCSPPASSLRSPSSAPSLRHRCLKTCEPRLSNLVPDPHLNNGSLPQEARTFSSWWTLQAVQNRDPPLPTRGMENGNQPPQPSPGVSLHSRAVGPRGIQTEPEAAPPDNWLLRPPLTEPRPRPAPPANSCCLTPGPGVQRPPRAQGVRKPQRTHASVCACVHLCLKLKSWVGQ